MQGTQARSLPQEDPTRLQAAESGDTGVRGHRLDPCPRKTPHASGQPGLGTQESDRKSVV